MTAYLYDPITREFVGVILLDKDPLGGGWLIPANAVQVKPDVANCPDNKTLVLNDAGTAWALIDDYRGETVYQLINGQPVQVQVNGLGTLSADMTLIKPEPKEGFLIDTFDAKSKQWLYRKNFADVVVYRTEDGVKHTLTANDRSVPDGYTEKPQPTPAHIWNTKTSDWQLDKAKQAEIDTQAAQAAGQQRLVEIEQAIHNHLEQVVAELGLGVESGDKLISLYAGYDNPLRLYAEAFGKHRAQVWVMAKQDKDLILAGKKPIPTVDEAVAAIPPFIMTEIKS